MVVSISKILFIETKIKQTKGRYESDFPSQGIVFPTLWFFFLTLGNFKENEKR
jgi:hypothetical protein